MPYQGVQQNPWEYLNPSKGEPNLRNGIQIAQSIGALSHFNWAELRRVTLLSSQPLRIAEHLCYCSIQRDQPRLGPYGTEY